MADNYLERREQELSEKAPARKRVVNNPSLDSLIKRTRSYRGYDNSRIVTKEELRSMVAAAQLAPCGMNRQELRYRLVTSEEADKILPHIKLGGALPELHLPFPGTEPRAFIVICSTVEESRIVDMDLGLAAQNILLKATSIGLGGIFILNFKVDEIAQNLALPLKPLAVIAIGKPAENIYITRVHKDAALAYYRKDGVHFVPKIELEEVLI